MTIFRPCFIRVSSVAKDFSATAVGLTSYLPACSTSRHVAWYNKLLSNLALVILAEKLRKAKT